MKHMKQSLFFTREMVMKKPNNLNAKIIKYVSVNIYNDDTLFIVKLTGFYDSKKSPIECGINIKEYTNEEKIKNKYIYHKIGIVQEDESIKWYIQTELFNYTYIKIDNIPYDELSELKLKELIESGVIV